MVSLDAKAGLIDSIVSVAIATVSVFVLSSVWYTAVTPGEVRALVDRRLASCLRSLDRTAQAPVAARGAAVSLG
jgi:hypothetical protein